MAKNAVGQVLRRWRLERGCARRIWRLLLGHARLETTMRYLVVGYSHVARKHKELSLGKQLLE